MKNAFCTSKEKGRWRQGENSLRSYFPSTDWVEETIVGIQREEDDSGYSGRRKRKRIWHRSWRINIIFPNGRGKGVPGLGDSVSKGREKVNTRQMQEMMCEAFGVHGGKLQKIRVWKLELNCHKAFMLSGLNFIPKSMLLNSKSNNTFGAVHFQGILKCTALFNSSSNSVRGAWSPLFDTWEQRLREITWSLQNYTTSKWRRSYHSWSVFLKDTLGRWICQQYAGWTREGK